jgi:hypothetical protein
MSTTPGAAIWRCLRGLLGRKRSGSSGRDKLSGRLWPHHAESHSHHALDTIYDVPSDRCLNAKSVLKHVTGGWQVAGTLGVANGAWLNVLQPSTFLNSRPDYNGANPYLNGDNRYLYLNRATFTLIPTGPSGAPIRPGNVGKNAFRGPGYWNLDFSIWKNFKFYERYGLTFRVDMFNATNSVRLGAPILQVNNALFGQITAVAPARTMQMALRFSF